MDGDDPNRELTFDDQLDFVLKVLATLPPPDLIIESNRLRCPDWETNEKRRNDNVASGYSAYKLIYALQAMTDATTSGFG